MEASRSRACWMASWGVLPSIDGVLPAPARRRTGSEPRHGAITRASKKCRSAASARFRVGSDPGISSMKRPASPGVT